jgi:carboxyl-terminal processing protease
VDGLSGSASECFTGGMQSLGRARVFGQVSMGQALPALFDRLPNGDVLIHAYGDFVTADGTRLEGRGVIPDEVVPLTREALAAGRDPALEAALAWIDGRQGGSGPEDE